MKKKIAAFLLMLFVATTSFAKSDDEKFCTMQGYASAGDDLKFYAGLLTRILINREIFSNPKCLKAMNAGKSYQVQLKKAFTADGFYPSKITPEMNTVIEDFAAFSKRIDTFILKNTGYLD
jgi:hypothetical protein